MIMPFIVARRVATLSNAVGEAWRARAAFRDKCKSQPHNLKRLLYKICFFKLRFFLVASFRKISYTKKDGTRPCYEHGRSLTTNHLHWKGDLWLTPILPAHQTTLAAHPILVAYRNPLS